ncbi:NAD-dependent malic enzyme [Candidatus Woesearchaeota archaeon]|nr:NAD-dependent malic enzyme [Candidatus Woesearchaeota archaeon]
MDVYEESFELHKKKKGKIVVKSKVRVKNKQDLSLAYTPGVAEVSRRIAANKNEVFECTLKANTIAVVSDGSAILGLGNLGAEAAIPVMEGKAVLFKEFAKLDAFPICLSTQDAQEIISTVKFIAPVFAGINLEDISAPRCFEVEAALQDIGIPVMHDDQHGTAVVVTAALMNAAKVVNKQFSELRVVINGAGAAGIAVTRLLLGVGVDKTLFTPVKEVVLCDTAGVIYEGRVENMNAYKAEIAKISNPKKIRGSLADAMKGADVFVGVSAPNIVTQGMVKSMAQSSIVFAMANPVPEIMPDEAMAAGAVVVATGRSDFPNQVNNALGFPGIFRGAVDAKSTKITTEMKLAAAFALAGCVEAPSADRIVPSPFEKNVVKSIAKAVKKAAIKAGVVRSKD